MTYESFLKDTIAIRKRLRPRNQWVLIRKIVRKEKTTEAGVVVPEEQEERSSTGIIVASAIGDLSPGQQVVFTAFPLSIESVEEITGDKNIFLVRDEEVYAVVEDEESCT